MKRNTFKRRKLKKMGGNLEQELRKEIKMRNACDACALCPESRRLNLAQREKKRAQREKKIAQVWREQLLAKRKEDQNHGVHSDDEYKRHFENATNSYDDRWADDWAEIFPAQSSAHRAHRVAEAPPAAIAEAEPQLPPRPPPPHQQDIQKLKRSFPNVKDSQIREALYRNNTFEEAVNMLQSSLSEVESINEKPEIAETPPPAPQSSAAEAEPPAKRPAEKRKPPPLAKHLRSPGKPPAP